MWQKKQIVLTAFLNFPNIKFHEQNFSFHFFTPYLLWMNWRDLFSFIMKCFWIRNFHSQVTRIILFLSCTINIKAKLTLATYTVIITH